MYTFTPVETSAPRKRLKLKWPYLLPFVGAALAALFVVLLVPDRLAEEPARPPGARPSLEVLPLESGGSRVRVDAAGAPYVLVASQNEAGSVRIRYPADGHRSARVAPGRVELPSAGPIAAGERLFAFFSDEPLRAGEVIAALEKGEDPARIAGVRDVAVAEPSGEQPGAGTGTQENTTR